MIIDTGEFEAIHDSLDRLEDALVQLATRYDEAMTARAIIAGTWAPPRPPGPRHARPRRSRHGLRLVEGGQQ